MNPIKAKKPIRIPFTEKEHMLLNKISEKSHLRKATKLTVILIDELASFLKKNKHEINLNFEYIENKVEDPFYVQIYVQMDIYSDLKKISDSTNISVPFICRYLIIPKVFTETKEG